MQLVNNPTNAPESQDWTSKKHLPETQYPALGLKPGSEPRILTRLAQH
jgi:hypothetical protein